MAENLTKNAKVYLKFARLLLLVFSFSGLLSIAFLDLNRFYFAWFAFVPLLAAINNKSLIQTYFIGTIAGFCLFASGTYWIADFINIAKDSHDSINFWLAMLYWFYCSQMIALLVVLYNWLKKNSGIHDFILFPTLLASFTSAYPMLFAMTLAETQIKFTSSLQAIDIFGPYALDAIIGLVNVMLYHLVINFVTVISLKKSSNIASDNSTSLSINKEKSISNSRMQFSKWSWSAAMSVILIWLVYGVYYSHWWELEVSNWQHIKVGLVQPNEVPELNKKKPYAGFSRAYPAEMAMSERLATIGAEIIIWPEANPKDYLNNEKVKLAYQASVKEMGAALLFQDIRRVLDSNVSRPTIHFNSAIMLDNKGKQVGLYNKIKRIPFGEYIPLLDQNSKLRAWLLNFLGKFFNRYSAGETHQLFQHQKINIIPLICYETTFTEFVSNSVSETSQLADSSNGTVLVALSNDGWFGSSHQPYQHVMGSVLRAVENRLPLIHVANNGPSIVVTPHGEIIFTSDFQQAGGYLVDVPHANSVEYSFYSKRPKLFVSLIYWTLGLMIVLTIARKIINYKTKD